MNNKYILDLTLRLSQALDQNYDVINIETVLSVISALEGTIITKEQLEATRLAKYINQLRRRTKCENLARRAKSLLKRWREMVGMQQSNEPSVTTSVVAYVPATTPNNAITNPISSFNIPASDNAVSTSQLTNTQLCHQQYQSSVKSHQFQQLPYRSEPSSPVNLQEKSNPNEFLISMSNPATGPQMPKSSNTTARKKKRLERNVNNELHAQQQQQPTSFANLLTGLGSTFPSSGKNTGDKAEPVTTSVKPVETFIIEHSSNSNSDLICIPSNNTLSCNFTSATDVPPIVIDLQDTNSSMNSVVSKDVTNVSSTYNRNKISAKKVKKDKKRKDRNTTLRQNQPLQDCDDQNTTNASFHNKRPSDVLLLDEKSHSACPTISNISEILSLSNSSMSSVFPSADAVSKNIFKSGQSELASSSAKMSKADLTFAGKFKQNVSTTSTGCNVLNYSSDNTNANVLNNNSLNKEKFSMFSGIGSNSNDSSSSSRTSSFHEAVKMEASNSRQNIEDNLLKHDVNEKSTSNMSNKGNSSTENTSALGASIVAETQHPQPIDLTTMEFSPQQAVKIPKKRGRKKGSKGVDSVIAKETSLSSQILISSLGFAGKKVKTTKELYAEMENRKLRKVGGFGKIPSNSSSNWIGQQHPQQQKQVISRRPSLCSDIVDSDSCTMTSEQSRDSGNIECKAEIGKRDTLLDNNSNYSKNDSELKAGEEKSEDNSRILTDESSVLEITIKIKLEIQEMLKNLPPPPSVKEIEFECFNNITPCTCTIEEVTVPADNESNEDIGDYNIKDMNINATNSTNNYERESKHLLTTIDQMNIVTNNLSRTDNVQKVVPPQPTQPAKIKKSIFDLDFDDDDDPLNLIKADIEGKNFKAEAEIKTISAAVVDKSELPLRTEDDLGKVYLQNAPYALNVPTSSPDNIVFPSYKINFDPECKAKNRFDIQTQKITKFHIDTLHNCYIPNVNGNWNCANTAKSRVCIQEENNIHKSNLIIDGYDVVPFYGSDIREQIVKDLSHIEFSKRFKVKHSKYQNACEILFHLPFAGVSRIPAVDDMKFYSKVIKKLTSEEEKENVDYKLNSNNILNTSALDTNDAKERKETGKEIVQNLKISSNATKLKTSKNFRKTGFKRPKKNATIVKRSTIKRLKLAEDMDASISEPASSDNTDELKLHKHLFYHEELNAVVRNCSLLHNENIFHISSCSSGCSSADEEATDKNFNYRKRAYSTSSLSSSSSSSDHHILNLQQEIIQTELRKMFASAAFIENDIKNENNLSDISAIENNEAITSNSANLNDDDGIDFDEYHLPKENNGMLLSFNNIYNKSTRDEHSEQQNKDHEDNMLKQQLQNCDDYNNLNNNFNLIKCIDNKNSSVNNINNNNSCRNNYSDTNVNISSSSSENLTNPVLIRRHNNNDNDVQIRPFKEYQTGIRAVDEDVNDDDGNNCGRLQQFKEWHEVLQVRSYNDELLTILPYVVLE